MIVASSIVLLALCTSNLRVGASLSPHRLSYHALVDGEWDRKDFFSALSASGMISVFDLPIPSRMFQNQHDCLLKNAVEVVEAVDGTIRYTVATETVGNDIQPIPVETSEDISCTKFLQGSQGYRSQVKEAVKMFSQALQEFIELNVADNTKERSSIPDVPEDTKGRIPNVPDLVANGRRLEHFHSYMKEKDSKDDSLKTLDWHIDQGLFLAFAPGRWSHSGETTQGFFVRTFDGTTEQVIFDNDVGLVFMLGDGVNQYINKNLPGNSKKLRAVPHALQIPASSDSRVWYGLMALPPVNAVALSGEHLALGCTQGSMTARSGRLLDVLEDQNKTLLDTDGNHSSVDGPGSVDEFGCVVGGEVYCWHRCMSIEEYVTDVSTEQCESGGKIITCINPRLQIWEGKRHGDFYPGCVPADAGVESPFPTLPDFPREDELCGSFASFAAEGVSDYEHEMPLLNRNNETVGVFQWTVESEEGQKSLSGRVAFNGIFGFLAFGLAGAGGKEGGTYHMLNAPIIMALPGANYTAFAGLDLDMEPTVAEYMTHSTETSFRHWSTPYATTEFRSLRKTDHKYDVSFDECYTAMTFSHVMDIAGSSLDLEGTDKMIWAANNQDYFVQYHGNNRKVFEIEWSSEDTLIASESGVASKTSMMFAGLVSALLVALS